MMESLINRNPSESEISQVQLDDRFDILGVIAEGANSIVYKAEHRVLNQLVAIKILKREITDNPSAQERFKREARLAVKLSHQNIVKLLGFGTNSNQENFLVMEYCQGSSLDNCIREKRMSSEELRAFGMQLADALSHAHKFGIVHRDIKPANIVAMRTEDEQTVFKLLDFGLAKEISTHVTADNDKLTRTAFIVGTPHYMSPEQCKSAAIDARSDIYSLGCVLYECATGRKTFAGDSSLVLMDLHLNGKVQFEPGDAVSNDLRQIILKCLEKSPEQRFQNASELFHALKAADTKVKAPSIRFRIPQMAFTLLSIFSLLGVCAFLTKSVMFPKADASSIVLHKKQNKPLIEQMKSHINSLSAEALMERAEASWASSKEQAIKLYKLAEQKALKENRPGLAALCKFEIGVKYTNRSEANLSISYIQTAINELLKLKQTIKLSILYVRLAEAYQRKGDAAKVIECYKLSEKYALENSQAKCFLDEKLGLAEFYFHEKKYQDACDTYQQVWNGFEDSLKKVKDRSRYAFQFVHMIHAELKLKKYEAVPQQISYLKARLAALNPADFDPAPSLFAANTALESGEFESAKELASIVVEYNQAREPLTLSIAKEIIKAADQKIPKLTSFDFSKTSEDELNKTWKENRSINLPQPTIGELLKSSH